MHSIVARRLVMVSYGEVALDSRSTSLENAVASYYACDCVELAWSYMRTDEVFILQENVHRPRGTAYKEGRKT